METADREELGRRVVERIDEHADDIVSVARQIHDHPEIAFQERFAAGLLGDNLRHYGFAVEAPVGKVETALRATAHGRGKGPTIAVLAEYDALPGVGHGCAHNLIAAAALATAIGVGPLMAELNGTFQVIGTPAEEAGGGKIALLDAGVFDGVDATLMVHHAGDKTGAPMEYPAGTCLAVADLRFEFFGRSAHAAGDPWEGANALNAVIKLFTGLDALRQHIRPEARVHGIITHGGDAPNVVPHYAAAEFYVRAGSRDEVQALEERMRNIAKGAALMTETRVEMTRVSPTYYDERPSYVIGRRYTEHMQEMGMDITPEERTRGSYSTDYGNVSYRLPTVTGAFAISREPIPGHSPEVVEAACSDFGHEQMLKVAKAMALTAVDLFTGPELLAAAKDEHAHWTERYERGQGE